MSDNGKVTAEQARELEQAPTSPVGKLRPDPDLLTSQDMRRARVMLKELHGDGAPSPYDLLTSENFEDKLPLVIWCLKSRTDPDYTWEQADTMPYGDLDLSTDEPPPPTGPGGSPGPASAKSALTGSSKRRPAATPARSSAPSTD
jgi:hypothetical protein